MKLIKNVWHYLVGDPFTWLFYYFCQPANFRQVFETKSISERILPMLRLALPIFIVSYPLSLFSNWWAIVLGIIAGIVWGIVVGIRWGIVGGIGLGVAFGFGLNPDNFTINNLSYLFLGFGCGLGLGMGIIGDILGITVLRILGSVKWRIMQLLKVIASLIKIGWSWIGNGIGAGIVAGMIGGLIGFFLGTILGRGVKNVSTGIVLSTIVGILVGILFADSKKNSNGDTSENVIERFASNVFRYLVWCIAGGLLGSITGAIFWSFLRDNPGITALAINWNNSGSKSDPNNVYLYLAIILCSITGAAIGIVLASVKKLRTNPGHEIDVKLKESFNIQPSIGRGFEEGIWLGIGWGILVGLVSLMTSHTLRGVFVLAFASGIFFWIYYLIGFYHFPLCVVDILSTFRAKEQSETNSSQVFMYLHRSALYWDESAVIRLPYLDKILHIAIGQNIDKVLEEITFIGAKRPHQLRAAQMSLIEIVLRDLEPRKTLRDIADASQQLAKFIQQGESILNSKWEAMLTYLYNASLDANHYRTLLWWQARKGALTSVIANLERVTEGIKEDSNVKTSSKKLENTLKQRLNMKVDKWLGTVQGELDKLNQEPEKTDQINNPYVVGPVLEQLGTSLFVGRRDLAQQLDQALRRGSERTTFFLNGERRMGKSSTLKQLPYLLDARFFPIYYDLQAPGISSSAAAFLGTVAEKICEEVGKKMQLEILERVSLQEANKISEAEVYSVFDEWLKYVEKQLEQRDWTLLLSFDEFEHLEKMGQTKNFDLHLLLNWFRSVIQNRPRFALLFSGGRSISEMGSEAGINWASYFVNVQTLKVSFLRETEARQLITRPVPDYPIEQIFGKLVVHEIIHMTGCHPFLVQAVCSAIVDNLNAEKRDQASIHDVAFAVNQVLENWEAYFQDLWDRTDQNQRVCLFTISNLEKGDLLQVVQQSGLDERMVRRAMETLRKRDLVLQDKGVYRIAAPIFALWVEHHF